MSWLQKTSKVIYISDTPGDIYHTLSYFIDKYHWSLAGVGQKTDNKGNFWKMIFKAADVPDIRAMPKYYVMILMIWEGKMNDTYRTEIGRAKLHFIAGILDESYSPITDDEEFETVTELCKWVKGEIDRFDGEESEEPDIAPDPTESAPVNVPSLVPAKNENRWRILYADGFEDYKFVEQLFREATEAIGSQDMQSVFDYMAPKLRERGLNPRYWISWIFSKRII